MLVIWLLQPIVFKWRQNSPSTDFASKQSRQLNALYHFGPCHACKQKVWHIFSSKLDVLHNLSQWFPTFFDAFLPLLILELFIPPLSNVHSSPVRVHRQVLTTIGTTVFIDDNNLINKSWDENYLLLNNGTNVCQQQGVMISNVNWYYWLKETMST